MFEGEHIDALSSFILGVFETIKYAVVESSVLTWRQVSPRFDWNLKWKESLRFFITYPTFELVGTVLPAPKDVYPIIKLICKEVFIYVAQNHKSKSFKSRDSIYH